MSRQLNPSQVWSQVPVANRLIEVNTKTGFSLTAGSYTIHASSVQRGTIALSNADNVNSTISSVTTTRTINLFSGTAVGSDNTRYLVYLTLTSATNLNSQRSSGISDATTSTLSYNVEETF